MNVQPLTWFRAEVVCEFGDGVEYRWPVRGLAATDELDARRQIRELFRCVTPRRFAIKNVKESNHD